MGDDAEALAAIGFAVTAFDIAPTAISWCKQRFSQSAVTYIVEDLLRPNLLLDRQFDFILEYLYPSSPTSRDSTPSDRKNCQIDRA